MRNKIYKLYRIDKEMKLGNKFFLHQPRINDLIFYKSEPYSFNYRINKKIKSIIIIYRIVSIWDNVLYLSPINYEGVSIKYSRKVK